MADAAPRGRGGFGSRGGDRGRGRGRRGRRGGKQEEKEWQPVTKLGRLVKAGKITSMEQIYLHSLPVKEYQIVDFFLPKLKDEVMKVRKRKISLRNSITVFAPDAYEFSGVEGLRIDRSWEWKRKGIAAMGADSCITDQTRPEADPCRSAYPFQGRRCHR